MVCLKEFFSKTFNAAAVVPAGDVISFLRIAGCKLECCAYKMDPKIV
jgi:hypothetical protein